MRKLLRPALDSLALLGVLLLIAVAPLAYLVTSKQAARGYSDDKTRPAAVARDRVRPVPVGLPPHLTVRDLDDLKGPATRALGTRGAERLMEILKSDEPLSESVVGLTTEGRAPYPYRYPALTRLLDETPGRGRTPSAAQLGAALIQLAVAEPERVNAGAAAFAVLERARGIGGCDIELNLLTLLGAEGDPEPDVVVEQGRRAMLMCPGDPTAGWILAQVQSQLPGLIRGLTDEPITNIRYGGGSETLAALRAQFPHSPDIWAATGDMHLRAGQNLDPKQPFAARSEYRLALASYQRVGELGAEYEAAIGTARALIGLHEPKRAAELVRSQLAKTETRGPVLQLLLAAEEAAHEFEAAMWTARELTVAATRLFPEPIQVFPDQWQGPLTTGIGQLVSLRVSLRQTAGGGAASLEDSSLVPLYVIDDMAGTDTTCPDMAWRRNAILAGHTEEASRNLPAQFKSVGPLPDAGYECGMDVPEFRELLMVVSGSQAKTPHHDDWWLEPIERLQNMWRWAGDLERALGVCKLWDQRTPRDAYVPEWRRGEILFLQEKYDRAAASFGSAARRAENDSDVVKRDELLLLRGAALVKANRRAEAIPMLRQLDTAAGEAIALNSRRQEEGLVQRWALLGYHARFWLAEAERREGQLAAASEDYAAALELLPRLEVPAEGFQPDNLRPEVLYNNGSIVDTGIGDLGEAEAKVQKAIAADPSNPIFLMTGGYVAERAGNTALAVERNAAALQNDEGAFSAANDLGVQLARLNRPKEARSALRRAVAARPDFALGWFNLGVLESDRGHLFVSQGAFGRAFELEPALKDRERVLTIDAHVYHTELDLAKPLPAQWTLADVERRQPAAAVGLLALLVLALGTLRTIKPAEGGQTEKWLNLVAAKIRRSPLRHHLRHPAWAIGAATIAFLLPIAWHRPIDVTQTIGYVVGLLTLLYVALRARQFAARRSATTVRLHTWPPGTLVSLVSGAAGTPWATLPAGQTKPTRSRVHRAAPLALAILAGVLLLEEVIFPVPLTRALAVAALTVSASTLLPIKPLDGYYLGKSTHLAAFGLVGAGVLIILGLL
jgi:tetratricopeptide (TPR) repeat protein